MDYKFYTGTNMDYMIQAREEEITVNRGLIYHYEEILKEKKRYMRKAILLMN